MHLDTRESGSILLRLAPSALLFLCVTAGSCASDREQQKPLAPPEASSTGAEEPAPETAPVEEEAPLQAGQEQEAAPEEEKGYPPGWGEPEDEGEEQPAEEPAGQEPAAQEPDAQEQAGQEPEPAPEQEKSYPPGWGVPEGEEPGVREPAAEQEPAREPRTEEVPAPWVPPDEESPFPDWMHGSLSVRYRARSDGDDQDHDVRGVLALDLADPRVRGMSGHLLARVDVDLEGLDEGEIFEDLADTYDQSVVSKVYLAYADVALDAEAGESPTLRVGRQNDPLLPEVLYLDGVSYFSRPMGEKDVAFGVYGGIPVHFYESSSEGDRAWGTFVEGHPWAGGRARFDWMHLEDEEVLGEGEDDLLSLGVWQELAKSWRLEGEYTHLEGDPRDLSLRAFYTDPDATTIVRAGYHELLEPQAALVTELDPFFEQLLEYEPFRQTNLVVSQAFGDHAIVDAGVDLRRVSDSDDVGEFNRDWERYYATASFVDVSAKGVGMSFTVDRWDDDDRDVSSLGADLSYDSEDRWDGAIGTYYSLYKYQFLELDEREDVRTYYLRASRELSKRLDLELLYEFEDDDFDTYHTLRLGALWQF